MSDIIIHYFDLHRKIVKNDSSEVESFDNYTQKRKNILNQIQVDRKYLEKIQKLFILQYIVEFFIGEALSEKAMNSYFRYLNDNHTKMVESILKNPENFRTIMRAIGHKNHEFVYFMLECLFVTENNLILNKCILNSFSKCKIDKYLVDRITNITFVDNRSNFFILFDPTFEIKESRCLALSLMLFSLTLNKSYPISIVHFFPDSNDVSTSTKLITNLIKLLCQKAYKNLAVLAENILDSLLEIFSSPKNIGDFSVFLLRTERLKFIERVVQISFDLDLFRSKSYFKVINMFLRRRIGEFATELSSKIDILGFYKEFYDHFSKENSCIFFSFLDRMVHSDLISHQKVNNVLQFVSFCKEKCETKKRVNNMLYSTILAFEKKFTDKFSACMMNEE